MKKIVKLIGEKSSDGPISVIMAGIHGNEICGMQAFKEVLPNLKIDYGLVHFVLGNPKAIQKKVRFLDLNLNRMFKSVENYSTEEKKTYEFRKAQELKKILQNAGALLDIHSSNSESSQPFIIAERNADLIVKNLPVKTIVNGFDIVEPGGTDSYMNSIGKVGICIECGSTSSPDSIEIAKTAINNFLITVGHTAKYEKINLVKQERIQMFELYHTQTDKFVLAKNFADFELVKKSTIIGKDGDNFVRAWEDSIILFARNRVQAGSEGFLLGRRI